MKALKINTETQTIEEIEINSWKDVAPAIGNGCTTFSCPVELDNMDTLYTDDEGLFHDIKGGIMMKGWDYPIVGNIIVQGTDDEGDSIDVKTTKEELEKLVIWVTEKAAKEWAAQFI